MCKCGIPYIVLEGNLDDWEKILEKLKFLKKYNFSRESIEEDLIEIITINKFWLKWQNYIHYLFSKIKYK